ncbi:hypothetical protein EDB89DRAFT_1866729, partial [Lactarius sanguifluus]
VEIYLNADDSSVQFLSIPLSDIQRLSFRPFKWLIFLMFCICGTRGDLSATLDGPPVDYNSTELARLRPLLTAVPISLGALIFADHEGLNDRVPGTSRGISTRQLCRDDDFRKGVKNRDASCVVTRLSAEASDAAHLIPWSKGDDYIQKVLQDRSPLYGTVSTNFGIDSIENGVLLTKTVHALLDRGSVAFIKTPNIITGLEPTDIRRVDFGPPRQDHVTLQRLQKPDDDDPAFLESLTTASVRKPRPFAAFAVGAHVDAMFRGTGRSPPSAVILDYVYGIAAYRSWSSLGPGGIHDIMDTYRRQNYAHLPHEPPNDEDSQEDSPPSRESDDPNDTEYDPSDDTSSGEPSDGSDPLPTSSQRTKTIHKLNTVLVLLQGVTPQEAANRREMKMEEAALNAQEAGQSKFKLLGPSLRRHPA